MFWFFERAARRCRLPSAAHAVPARGRPTAQGAARAERLQNAAVQGRLPLLRKREPCRSCESEYGWVDKEGGVVHIPIERAMDVLLERGSAGACPTAAGRNVVTQDSFGGPDRSSRGEHGDVVTWPAALGGDGCMSVMCAHDGRRVCAGRGARASTRRHPTCERQDAGGAVARWRSTSASTQQLPLDAAVQRRGTARPSSSATTSATRPVVCVMTFVYYECPMLCTSGAERPGPSALRRDRPRPSARSSTSSPSASIRAKRPCWPPPRRRRTYRIATSGRERPPQGWHFLTGDEGRDRRA